MLAVGGRAGQGLGDKVLMRGESTKVVGGLGENFADRYILRF